MSDDEWPRWADRTVWAGHSVLGAGEARGQSVRVVAWMQGPTLYVAGLRALLTSLPGLELAAVATRPDDVLPAVERHDPDVTLMILQRLGRQSVRVVQGLNAVGTAVRTVVVSELVSSGHIESLIRLGVRGMFSASISPERLLAALRLIQSGEIVLDSAVASIVFGVSAQKSTLTARQDQIVALLARGAGNQEIARQLAVSPSTLKRELRQVRAKLKIKDRVEIAAYAFNAGLDWTGASTGQLWTSCRP